MYEIPWKKLADALPDPETDLLVTDGTDVWVAWLTRNNTTDTDREYAELSTSWRRENGTVSGAWTDVPTHWAPMPALP